MCNIYYCVVTWQRKPSPEIRKCELGTDRQLCTRLMHQVEEASTVTGGPAINKLL